LLTIAAVLCLAGCGVDNVGACERWKTAVKCGSANVDAITACDISGYFDYLSTAYVCVNGQYDTSKLANSAACASKAVCR
jgi:hypothetical protein